MEIIIIVLILVDIGARVAPFLMKKKEIQVKDEKAVELAKKRIEGFNNLNRIESYLKENNHLKILGVYTEFNSKKTDNQKYEAFKSTISFLSNDILLHELKIKNIRIKRY